MLFPWHPSSLHCARPGSLVGTENRDDSDKLPSYSELRFPSSLPKLIVREQKFWAKVRRLGVF